MEKNFLASASITSIITAILLFAFSAHSKISESSAHLVLYKSTFEKGFPESYGRRDKIEKLRVEALTLQQRAFAGFEFQSVKTLETLWIVNGTLAHLDSSQVRKLKKMPFVRSVFPLKEKAFLIPPMTAASQLRSPFFNQKYTYGLEALGLPILHQMYPDLDGAGVKIGIIDTGIDSNHPDLKGKVSDFRDFIFNKKVPYDDNSHGTHVAGLVSGASNSGQRIGVATGVKLIVAKTFSTYGGYEAKHLLLALQWMADPDGNSATDDGADIISNSWNTDGEIKTANPEDNAFCIAIENLKSIGIISVFSAGNDGPSSASIKIPGACPSAFTVGSIDQDNIIAKSSSRGPIRWKNQTTFKPDVVAPGVNVYSSVPGGGYGTKSGTSMSTPFVAGALALLLQSQIGEEQYDVEGRVKGTALDLGPNGFDESYGHGLVDLPRAVKGGWL